MTPTPMPYLTSPAAYAVARRLEKKGLLEPDFWVQLLPVCLAETDTINYVLRYFASPHAEESVAQVHFMEIKKGGKSAAIIEQLQEELKWGFGEFIPNFRLVRNLPTLVNTRRYKLQLLAQ